jgi:hypothetical protein
MVDGDNALRVKSNSGKTGLIQGYEDVLLVDLVILQS